MPLKLKLLIVLMCIRRLVKIADFIAELGWHLLDETINYYSRKWSENNAIS